LEDEQANFTTITGPKPYRNGQAVSNPTSLPTSHRQEDAHTILALMVPGRTGVS